MNQRNPAGCGNGAPTGSHDQAQFQNTRTSPEEYFSCLLKNMHACNVCVLSCFSRVQLLATLWIVARQAPLSMGFSRQEHWSGLPCPPPGDLPDPGIKPESLMSPTLAGGFSTTSATWEAPFEEHLLLVIVFNMCLRLMVW